MDATDVVSEGDDHLRLLKATILNTFPNLTGAMTRTQAQLNQAAIKNEDNTFTQDVTVQGAFTSLGIADGASSRRFELSDSAILLSDAGRTEFSLVTASNAHQMHISSGVTQGNGANITLFGSAHSSQTFDMEFRNDSSVRLRYDYSARTWDFIGEAITTTGQINCGTLASSGVVSAQTELRAGVNDVSGGLFRLYGPALGNTGGQVFIYTSAEHDAVYNYFSMIAFQDTLAIGSSVNGLNGLRWLPASSVWDFQANAIATTGAITTPGAITGGTINGAISATTLDASGASTVAALTASGEIKGNAGMKGTVTGSGVAAGEGRFEVVSALPGTPDANTIYFVV